MNLIKEIIKETLDYRYTPITIVPGLFFDQFQTINTIYFYYNSKYQSGDTDDEGDRKYFYNVVLNPCMIYEKSIDFDTKNIRLLTVGGGDTYKTWFMERDLKYWMRDKQFGKTLNRIFHELPIFGSVVIKIVKGMPYFVDLRNFIIEKSADDLDGSSYIIESHNMTIAEFRKKGKLMNWPQAKIDETIMKFREMKASLLTVYERYGEVQDEKDPMKFSYQRTFIADVGEEKYMQTNTGQILISERGVLLATEDWDKHPYYEFHGRKIPGRWLGIGVVETLFEPQIRHNELTNLQAKSSFWAALRIWQSRSTVNKNLKNDVRNGQVVDGLDSEITQVDMTDRNLAFFNEEYQRWGKNVNDLTIAFAPIGHSVIAIQVALDQVVSYFEQIQEDVALSVKEMIYDALIPEFEKDMTAEHTLRLVGKDLDTYISFVKNQLVNDEIMKIVLTQNKWPTNADQQVIGIAIEQSIKQGKEQILTVPKNAYKDVKYDIDIDITGESVDTKAQSATKLSILQAITADPTMTTDPTKKALLSSYMEDVGINPNDILATQSQSPDEIMAKNGQQVPSRGGGGVSAPVPSPAGMAPKQTTTI